MLISYFMPVINQLLIIWHELIELSADSACFSQLLFAVSISLPMYNKTILDQETSINISTEIWSKLDNTD